MGHGPFELLLFHGGQKANIYQTLHGTRDDEPWVISSVAGDNGHQAWQMAESIYNHDDAGDQNAQQSNKTRNDSNISGSESLATHLFKDLTRNTKTTPHQHLKTVIQ
ncbi:hypothetical protein HID58_000318 [Brassica napus]|uniref:Uncharacterized protein n=1 Tax=Brassica napus TaxID=3708 RepID=A0ABQ8EG85_BRANA|nr:hypothetical protein HID58_000318 [Brassica napus]